MTSVGIRTNRMNTTILLLLFLFFFILTGCSKDSEKAKSPSSLNKDQSDLYQQKNDQVVSPNKQMLDSMKEIEKKISNLKPGGRVFIGRQPTKKELELIENIDSQDR